ncbi:Hsp70 family protein [Actinomycetes bacterium KLBMP 9797]
MGIDFGTSHTVAMLGWPDGRARPVLFDGAPLLPSAVYADPSGELVVGRDAVAAALSYPERFEPYPKRRIDDGVLLLGDAAVPVSEAIAAVLRRVVTETHRVAGQWPSEAILTHPAAWGARRRAALLEGAARAGIHAPRLVPEPLAAAFHFAQLLGTQLPIDGHLLIYDFGAGTFDASVVRRTPDGFAVVTSEGLGDTGGLDVDAAFVAHLGAVYGGRDPAAWRRLEYPSSPADRRYSRQLWDGVRAAKEALSRTSSALVHVPVLEQDAPIAREQLDQLARPVIDRTVAAARSALLDAQVDLRQLAAVVLVGGASRMPIVATQLHRVLGIAATVLEQPELVVAEGSLLAAAPAPAPSVAAVSAAAVTVAGPASQAAPAAPAAVEPPTVAMQPVRAASTPIPAVAPLDERPGSRLRKALPVLAATAVVIVLAATGLVLSKVLPNQDGGDNGNDQFADNGTGFFTPGAAGVSGGVPGSPGASGQPGAGPSGLPSGSPGASGGPGSSSRPSGSVSTSSGSGSSTTKAPGGVQGTAGARRTTNADPAWCEIMDLAMSRTSGSGSPPKISFEACLNDHGGSSVWVHGKAKLAQPGNYAQYSYKGRILIETYECKGGSDKVDTQDSGVVTESGSTHLTNEININHYSFSNSYVVKAKLISLEFVLDGTRWTATSATVNSPCHNPWF